MTSGLAVEPCASRVARADDVAAPDAATVPLWVRRPRLKFKRHSVVDCINPPR